jgi:hypothetical protein
MKDIVTFINEVSKGLAQRAYNKATGAQKNRIKKLYKEIYGDDVTKSDVSHIEFDFYDDAKYEDIFTHDEIKEAFSLWDQETLNKINNISIYYSYEHEGNSSFIQTGSFEIVIDGKSYKMEYEYKYDYGKILSSSLKSKDPDTADIFIYIAQLYKEKYSK